MPETKGRSSGVNFDPDSRVEIGGDVTSGDKNTENGVVDMVSAIEYDPDGHRMESKMDLGKEFTDKFGDVWEFRRAYTNDKGQIRYRYTHLRRGNDDKNASEGSARDKGGSRRTGGVDIEADESGTKITTARGEEHIANGRKIGDVVGRDHITNNKVIHTGGGAYIGGGVSVGEGGNFSGRDRHVEKDNDFIFPEIDDSTIPPSEIYTRRSVSETVIKDAKGREFVFAGISKRYGEFVFVTRAYAQEYERKNGKPINGLYSHAFTGGLLDTHRNVKYKMVIGEDDQPVQTKDGFLYIPLETSEDDWV